MSNKKMSREEFQKIKERSDKIRKDFENIDIKGLDEVKTFNQVLNCIKQCLIEYEKDKLFNAMDDIFNFCIRNKIKIINQTDIQDFIIDYKCKQFEEKNKKE